MSLLSFGIRINFQNCDVSGVIFFSASRYKANTPGSTRGAVSAPRQRSLITLELRRIDLEFRQPNDVAIVTDESLRGHSYSEYEECANNSERLFRMVAFPF